MQRGGRLHLEEPVENDDEVLGAQFGGSISDFEAANVAAEVESDLQQMH